jgi:phosphoribosylaminoimidazole-succinocarboxamide synthase
MTMELPRVHSGKVRELYDAGEGRLLMVASDRVSAFDVIMTEPIADKGRVLTAMTSFWCEEMADVVPGTIVAVDPAAIEEALGGATLPAGWAGRAQLVRRADMLPLECIVRGYLAGQAYEEYARAGTVHGTAMPPGLQLASRLPEPIFTPSTKADEGHDETIDFERAAELVGDSALIGRVRDASIELYSFAAAHAREHGVILADTKFEFGLDPDGSLIVGDEVLTPDSSRYWPADGYEVGHGQPSFDKQYVRDWATGSGWDKLPPAPAIPDDVVAGTRDRYVEAYERIVGKPFSDWLELTGAE